MSTANHPNKLGYERLRSQNFEGKTAGDLKEGFFFGRDLPADHPYVQQGRIHCGNNVYPAEVSDRDLFRDTVNQYHREMTALAENILCVIAMTLNLDEDYFRPFCQEPAAVLRLLHYPPQAPDASADERGIGAHTDFGGVTLLLQDEVGGLQVFDAPTRSWIDVKPTPGALVVNLGNVMMRWSNDTYVSNLHRVINKSGKERFSVPFFYSGNPDFVIDCLPGCEGVAGRSKYAPIRCEDWILGRHTNTFREAKGLDELSTLAKVA
jgi:isopenicillin N synthase-like dioxygenase